MTMTDAERLLSEFVKHYAPGTCKRCDPIYWSAMRWDLIRKGRNVPNVTDVSEERWGEIVKERGL